MRAVVQRVHAARVEVEGEVVGAVGHGLCAFVGAEQGDGEADARALAEKLLHLRIFEDEAGKMARSVLDVGGGVLVVSQFTLLGDTRRGRRPSFTRALEPEAARALIDRVAAELGHQVTVATGRFGAEMRVVVDNHGPVTILFDTRGG